MNSSARAALIRVRHTGAILCATVLGCVAAVPPVAAETYSLVLTASTIKSWTNSATWNPAGVPVAGDTVTLGSLPWPQGMEVNTATDWGAQTINIAATQGNQHKLNIIVNGQVGTINYSNTVSNGYSWRVPTGSGKTLTLTRWIESGTALPNSHFPATDSTWAFVGDAVIQYSTIPMYGGTVGSLTKLNVTTARMNFSGATSVELRRNPNTALQQEYVTTAVNNYADPITIGRNDNLEQVWSIGSGSHPLLMPGGTSQDGGFRKVGSGAVTMPEVDLMFELSVAHGADDGDAISSDGILSGSIYSGEVHAHSLRIGALAATTAARTAAILGVLRLYGESGLQAGGTGTGRALDVVVDNYNLHLRIQAGSSSIAIGKIVAQTDAGAFHFASTGSGKVKVNINNNSRDVKTHREKPLLVANDLFLGNGAYLHDRNDWSESFSPGTANNDSGGTLECKGKIDWSSVERTLWRTDSTTLHCVTGTVQTVSTLECPSQDLGTAGPGVSNFLLNKLVVGKAADATTGRKQVMLTDGYDNNTLDADPEALYVNTLELYAGSEVVLQGRNLYVKNSGSWVKAMPGAFAAGDGTGRIIRKLPNDGTTILVK